MNFFQFSPIGYIRTCFAEKNGTPRQPAISASSKGQLKILKSVFNNPEHSLNGLSEFSHVWIIFVFHLNAGKIVKPKVKPPRLDGAKCGVFSTRTPHRPNAIGLTLAKLDLIEYDTLYVSGIDMVDNTPVLDVKPFIEHYDQPQLFSSASTNFSCIDVNREVKGSASNDCNNTDVNSKEVFNCIGVTDTICSQSQSANRCSSVEINTNKSTSYAASWIFNPPISSLNVIFSNRALDNLKKFASVSSGVSKENSDWVLKLLKSEDLQKVIVDVLKADPRSSYRRKKCCDRLYYFTVDNVHVTTWFDEITSPHSVEVLRIIPKKLINL